MTPNVGAVTKRVSRTRGGPPRLAEPSDTPTGFMICAIRRIDCDRILFKPGSSLPHLQRDGSRRVLRSERHCRLLALRVSAFPISRPIDGALRSALGRERIETRHFLRGTWGRFPRYHRT